MTYLSLEASDRNSTITRQFYIRIAFRILLQYVVFATTRALVLALALALLLWFVFETLIAVFFLLLLVRRLDLGVGLL